MASGATTAPDVMRGVAGGVILGLPLVYTQETWLHGRAVHPLVILAALLATLGIADEVGLDDPARRHASRRLGRLSGHHRRLGR